MLIGLTGQIGAGKSEAAKIFKKLGAYVISADQIGKEVVENNQIVIKELAACFGDNILTPGGRLRRNNLGRIAFASEKKKKELDRIVHPYLLKELARQTKQARKTHDIVIIDAALLIDWRWHHKVDIAILIHAPDKIKMARLLKNGYKRIEAVARINSQLKYRYLRARSDIVVFNNKSLESLEVKLRKIFKKLV